jgi:4-hydroxymandelate oxidase
MADKQLTVTQLYTRGIQNLKEKNNIDWNYPPAGRAGNSLRMTRSYLNSWFFVPRFIDPPVVDTNLTLFGVKLKTPVFCSAISRRAYMPEKSLTEIARGIAATGSLMLLGIGGSIELQGAIDTGAHVVKMVKPYRNTELIYDKVREAESLGCVAIGMDIDHFYGRFGVDGDVSMTDLFAPQSVTELRQIVSATKLPFVIKGVLSLADAENALQLGASAIVVSNHGCFSLESAIPSVAALSEIADKFGKKLTIMVDSGFETGNDALKGLALGAKVVGFGSSVVLAWLADSTKGVELLINQLTAEISRTMAATGCADLKSIPRSIIVRLP